ncbi:SET domain-containing protein-lysine N-methyltransferase [Maricaulis maris]|uniref:SET domain-containing protein n=1 Tax=Maricaulis maris TaxID=74318 RepID=A0A495DJI7_9PROT|nr:SET domain-containing protein-lysine N-methyltransferase [Maricaulis maris]RKR02790.1 SET domain-containing protein [Maricaulis maris]
MTQFLGATRAASVPVHLIGFHVALDGTRLYDRIALTIDEDGRVGGTLDRIAERDGVPHRAELRGLLVGERLAVMLEFDGVSPSGVMLDLVPEACLHGGAMSGRIAGGDGEAALPYVMAHAPAARLDRSPTHGWGTVLVTPVAAGETVVGIDGPVGAEQTPYSFRTDDNRHVEPTGYGHFVNHACEPSCEIVYDLETALPTLVALRDLAAGDEVTFDYTRTEGQLAGSFQCRCPAPVHKV